MTIYYWKSPVNGSWITASNWTPTGGPQILPYGDSVDGAVFATGSHKPYTVTTGGESGSVLVKGDHVTFDHFGNSDFGRGGLSLTNGANVTLTATSSVQYYHNSSGGSIDVNASTLIDYGGAYAASSTVSGNALLDVSGSLANMFVFGFNVMAKGLLEVSHGGTFSQGGPPSNSSTINGTFEVTGSGSTAGLIDPSGTGKIEISNHGAMSVGIIDYTYFGVPVNNGNLQFTLGNYANLEFSEYSQNRAARSVDFTGQHATMTLTVNPGSSIPQPYEAQGLIKDFSQTDAIVLKGTPVTKVVYVAGSRGGAGSLHLFDGTAAVGTLAIAGNYSGRTFSVTAVSATESRITEKATPHEPDLCKEIAKALASLDSSQLARELVSLPNGLGAAISQVASSLLAANHDKITGHLVDFAALHVSHNSTIEQLLHS